VSKDFGRCDPVPSFVATSCDALAAEFGTAIDREMLDDAGAVLGAARVLDVEEDRPPAIRVGAVGRGRRDADREARLGDRELNLRLVLDELHGDRWRRRQGLDVDRRLEGLDLRRRRLAAARG